MTNELKQIDQSQLPYFDQYFKHNDYIKNFELAAAMDISQHRIFDTLMSCLQTLNHHKQKYLFETTTGEKKISMNLEFFMKRYLKAHNIKTIKRTEIRTAIKSLNKISVVKDTEDGVIGVSVFPYANANITKNTIDIEISKHFSYDTLIPTKLDIKTPGYTKLFNSKQIELKSIYSRILYQYFISLLAFKHSIIKVLSVSELHKMLGIVDENGKFLRGKKGYSDVAQFKRRCLKESIESINSNTDIFVEFKDLKTGRKILGFEFYASIRKHEKTENEASNQLTAFKPNIKDFKTKDDFVKYMKINYKGQKITNNVLGYNPSDYLVIDKEGLLKMENKEGIYNFVKDNQKSSKIAIEKWEWLYKNIEKVGCFEQVNKLDDLNFEFNSKQIDLKGNIFKIIKIEKNESEWIVKIEKDGKTGSVKIPLTNNLVEYLNDKRVY